MSMRDDFLLLVQTAVLAIPIPLSDKLYILSCAMDIPERYFVQLGGLSLLMMAHGYTQWKFYYEDEPDWHRAWRESQEKGGKDG